MSTPTTPTSPALTSDLPLPAVQADVPPADAMKHVRSAVRTFFTTVYCELLQIIILAILASVAGNLLSALLVAIVIVSAIGYVNMNFAIM